MKTYQLVYLYPMRFIFLALSFIFSIFRWIFENGENGLFEVSYWAELKTKNILGNPKGRFYHKL